MAQNIRSVGISSAMITTSKDQQSTVGPLNKNIIGTKNHILIEEVFLLKGN